MNYVEEGSQCLVGAVSLEEAIRKFSNIFPAEYPLKVRECQKKIMIYRSSYDEILATPVTEPKSWIKVGDMEFGEVCYEEKIFVIERKTNEVVSTKLSLNVVAQKLAASGVEAVQKKIRERVRSRGSAILVTKLEFFRRK